MFFKSKKNTYAHPELNSHDELTQKLYYDRIKYGKQSERLNVDRAANNSAYKWTKSGPNFYNYNEKKNYNLDENAYMDQPLPRREDFERPYEAYNIFKSL